MLRERKLALTVRLAVSGLAAALIVAGHIDHIVGGHNVVGEMPDREFNSVFYAWLIVDLIPPLLLAVGVRRLKTAVVCGAVLLLLSSVPWALGLMGDPEAFGFVIFGYPITLITCLTGALIDLGKTYRGRIEEYRNR